MCTIRYLNKILMYFFINAGDDRNISDTNSSQNVVINELLRILISLQFIDLIYFLRLFT